MGEGHELDMGACRQDGGIPGDKVSSGRDRRVLPPQMFEEEVRHTFSAALHCCFTRRLVFDVLAVCFACGQTSS